MFALPIPKLLHVQVGTRKKVGILMTFAVGLFVTTCSIIRLSYVVRWRKSTDPTWTYTVVALWSLVEVNVGVVCACMPSLAGPIKRFWMAAVGQHLSNLYESRSKKTEPDEIRPGTGGNDWRQVSHKPSGNSNSIMRNVSLNISDEVELVDKSAGMSKGATATSKHVYREKW